MRSEIIVIQYYILVYCVVRVYKLYSPLRNSCLKAQVDKIRLLSFLSSGSCLRYLDETGPVELPAENIPLVSYILVKYNVDLSSSPCGQWRLFRFEKYILLKKYSVAQFFIRTQDCSTFSQLVPTIIVFTFSTTDFFQSKWSSSAKMNRTSCTKYKISSLPNEKVLVDFKMYFNF